MSETPAKESWFKQHWAYGWFTAVATVAAVVIPVGYSWLSQPEKDGANLIAQGSTHPYTMMDGIKAEGKPAEGYTVITIKNSGNLPAKAVAVHVAGNGWVRIEKMGEQGQFDSYTDKVAIGSLPVEEVVTLKIWSEAIITADRLLIAYEGGTAHVSLREAKPEHERSNWFYFFTVGLPVCLAIGITVGAVRQMNESIHEAREANQEIIRLMKENESKE